MRQPPTSISIPWQQRSCGRACGFAFRYPDEAWNFSGVVVLFMVPVVLIYASIIRAIIGYLRRLSREQSVLTRSEAFHMTVSAAGLETRSVNTASMLRWPAFASVRTTKKNLVLQLRAGGALAIPLRYLDEPARRFILDALGKG